ncbi:MAG: hypothetical protein LUD12_03120 [Lachnospiraceae bacterium]|nr:hypothetical protein [Lachnospiraceae bacterium]
MRRNVYRNRYKGILTGFLCLLLLCGVCQRAGAMETGIDTSKTDGTLTVSYIYGTDSDTEKNTAISGASFHIYRIAEISSGGVYTLVSGLADSGVTSDQLNQMEHAQEMNNVIEAIASFLEDEKSEQAHRGAASFTEYQQAATDENGVAKFENLEVGLYLLTADEWTQDDVTYNSIPSLVSIPTADDSGTEWEYDVAVSAKVEAVSASLDDEEPSTGSGSDSPEEPSTGSGENPPEEPSTGTEEKPSEETEEPTTGETGSDVEPESEYPAEPDTEPESELPMETNPEPESTSAEETETEGMTESELTTESETTPATEDETDPVTESETAVVTESETTAVNESETASTASETESETSTEAAVQTGDTTPLETWMLVLVFSAGAVILLAVQQRRRHVR